MKLLETEHGTIMFDDEDYIRFIELTDYYLTLAIGRLLLKFLKTNRTLTSFILGHRRRVTFLDGNVFNVMKENLAVAKLNDVPEPLHPIIDIEKIIAKLDRSGLWTRNQLL